MSKVAAQNSYRASTSKTAYKFNTTNTNTVYLSLTQYSVGNPNFKLEFGLGNFITVTWKYTYSSTVKIGTENAYGANTRVESLTFESSSSVEYGAPILHLKNVQNNTFYTQSFTRNTSNPYMSTIYNGYTYNVSSRSYTNTLLYDDYGAGTSQLGYYTETLGWGRNVYVFSTWSTVKNNGVSSTTSSMTTQYGIYSDTITKTFRRASNAQSFLTVTNWETTYSLGNYGINVTSNITSGTTDASSRVQKYATTRNNNFSNEQLYYRSVSVRYYDGFTFTASRSSGFFTSYYNPTIGLNCGYQGTYTAYTRTSQYWYWPA